MGSRLCFRFGHSEVVSGYVHFLTTGSDGAEAYRCELKPGYRFK